LTKLSKFDLSVSFEAKIIYYILVTLRSLYHSLWIWHGRKLIVWAHYVEVACKVVVCISYRTQKKNNEVHMMENNALYRCVETSGV